MEWLLMILGMIVAAGAAIFIAIKVHNALKVKSPNLAILVSALSFLVSFTIIGFGLLVIIFMSIGFER